MSNLQQRRHDAWEVQARRIRELQQREREYKLYIEALEAMLDAAHRQSGVSMQYDEWEETLLQKVEEPE
jgi:hypothetical protein